MPRRALALLFLGLALLLVIAFAIPGSRIRILAKLQGEPFVDGKPCRLWIRLLHESEDEHTRMDAVVALGSMARARADARAAVIEALHDAEPLVKMQAQHELKQLGPIARDAIPQLLEMIKNPSEDDMVRWRTAEVLLAVGVDEEALVIQALQEAEKDADPHMRTSAVAALIKLKGNDIQFIVAYLKSPDEDTRRTATGALGKHEAAASAALPALLAALNVEEITSLKMLMLLTSRRLDPEGTTVIPVLIRHLRDPHKDVRWTAAVALGKYERRASAAVPELERLLQDPDESVRNQTQEALAEIRPDK